uniref:Uncharacterized protein n=1 Tax=Erwinia amylovora ATCC BAA-2158 TaxID=889211 RepID=E5B367_ERWAM|nr:hypothetical protein predicted by Glimmer/Critica [Erwinia amylovora ATCC BAA-2158]
MASLSVPHCQVAGFRTGRELKKTVPVSKVAMGYWPCSGFESPHL